jgi:hypothetical protein
VQLSSNPIQNYAGEAQGRSMIPKPLGERRHGLSLGTRVDYQHDRPALSLGKVGGGTVVGCASHHRAIEQAHHAFDDKKIGVTRRSGCQGVKKGRPHRPTIEIDAGPSTRGGVKTRIYIIRSGLGRGHPDTPVAQRPQQAKGNYGFARAGSGRRDDQAGRDNGFGHPTSS